MIGGTNFGVGGNNIINAAQNIGSLGQGLNLGVVEGAINIPGIGEVLNLAFLARALATSADANILSTPTIQTLDNEEAKFLVGQNIPLITGSFTLRLEALAPSIRSRPSSGSDIGLQLRVKPQISEGGVVRLAIYQELSSIQNTLTAAQGGIITNKRSFESSVLVEDGNIVVLGGLIEDRIDNSQSSVPVLGDIPLVGGLFRYENRGRRKTNLLVFLRPYVVRDEVTSSVAGARSVRLYPRPGRRRHSAGHLGIPRFAGTATAPDAHCSADDAPPARGRTRLHRPRGVDPATRALEAALAAAQRASGSAPPRSLT